VDDLDGAQWPPGFAYGTTMSTDRLLQIGEAAESVGMSLRTVRYWEEIGLVRPEARSKGGFRLYSGADLHRLLVIKAMKPLGLTLEEMRELLDLLDEAAPPDAPDEVFDRLRVLADRVQDQVEQMERDVAESRVLLAELMASLDGRADRMAVVID
jgi:DNA-binding transcriptional MerR regulator